MNLWKIDSMSSATLLGTLKGHSSKLCLMSYHPGVAGLLATCDTSGTLILWDSHSQAKVNTYNFLCVTFSFSLCD